MNATLRTRTFSVLGAARPSLLGLIALGSTLSIVACEDDQATPAQLSQSSQPLDAAQVPEPASERFAVGTSAYEWIDRARAEELTPEADDLRTLVVRAWYPTDATGEPARAPYFLNPVQAQLNAELGGLPPEALAAFELAARVDAPLRAGTSQFPVLVFSPGLSTPLEYYGYQLSDLASRGYVIFALSHPYSTGVVVFSDGHSAPELPEESLPQRRDGSIATWSLDQRFALSQIERLAAAGSEDRMAGRLDLGRVGVFGHSRGGAAAAETCSLDARFVACANLDGSISTLLQSSAPPQPFLLMRSDVIEPTLDEFFTRLPGRAHRVFIPAAGHNDFSDLPRLVDVLQLPVDREALMLGTLAPERSFEINAAYLSAFFGLEFLGAATPLFSEPAPFAEVQVTEQQQP